jgi:glyceraldehyde 3-phosphate dehydrogenase
VARRGGLSRHLQARGVSKVILTAPGKGALKNIVHGVNHADISADRIITAASARPTRSRC